ncbi:hypothetical protein ANRL3_00483 [Anaerolineae bacterium]|nr:hypothetical protein ANRL3_00483 [Anaerolineae bacterium]
MRIDNLHTEQHGPRQRVAATVTWEDCDRPARQVYFETDQAFAEALTLNPNAFVTACIIPAMHHHEQRLTIDAPICPELRNGLITAMNWQQVWYPEGSIVRIEAKADAQPIGPRDARRTAVFLSGGVDSVSTLRGNRLDFPLDHPGSIKDGLVVHGFDISGTQVSGDQTRLFERALEALSPIAGEAGVTLIPVSTNLRLLDDSVEFWMYKFHGAALAAVAHALANRIGAVYIASTYDIRNMRPWGSHPLLDPLYSSTDLQVRHAYDRLSRLDKVRLIADWPTALHNLRTCTENDPGALNCGKCEKCIRTMLELLAVRKLAHSSAFAADDVTVDMLRDLHITNAYQNSCYRDLLEPLIANGRADLAAAIEARSTEFQRHLRWTEERDWKGAVKKFDRKFLGRGLYRAYQSLRALA